ncbi:hypothetical protein [Haliangium ochraceum]|uniref:hypothetical protein n=1 Tax=Haliangium ochraceum TaxID=80816 RepID=UPI00126A3B61|nr:hypothetical protein [Haliangium ochraceum]
MSDEVERLRQIGIHIIDDEEDPMVRAECIRIARRLHLSRNKVIGFIPATDEVAVPPVIIQLGIALTELTLGTIAVVDANVRWPGLSGMVSAGGQSEASSESGDEGGGLLDADTLFHTKWLRGSLALLTPPHAEQAGEAVPQLARLLLSGTDLFEHILVDLTGFDLLGEHASAAACMDTTVLVGRAHQSREHQLLTMEKAMPRNRFMGVLLVG